MPDDIEQEMVETSIKLANDMRMEALRKFGEDFNVDMRTEMKQTPSPLEVADSFPDEEEAVPDDPDGS